MLVSFFLPWNSIGVESAGVRHVDPPSSAKPNASPDSKVESRDQRSQRASRMLSKMCYPTRLSKTCRFANMLGYTSCLANISIRWSGTSEACGVSCLDRVASLVSSKGTCAPIPHDFRRRLIKNRMEQALVSNSGLVSGLFEASKVEFTSSVGFQESPRFLKRGACSGLAVDH